jgi:hypothetical protein
MLGILKSHMAFELHLIVATVKLNNGKLRGFFSSLYVLSIRELLAPAIGAFNSASQTAARAWASTPKGAAL